MFDFLSLAAVIGGSIFCVHGGLSPEVHLLDEVRLLRRRREIPAEGPICDLMWSDPEDITEGWAISPRGAGFLFGANPTREFCFENGVGLVVRAHQLVMSGYRYWFPEKSVFTVWSAPNYCYSCGNEAAVLSFNEQLERRIDAFDAALDNSRAVPYKAIVPYFL